MAEASGSRPGREGWYLGLLVAAFVLVYGAFGPVVPIGKGFGWDGILYGDLARNFFETFHSSALRTDRVGRVLPSFLIYQVLGGLGLERSLEQVRFAFVVLNAISLLGASVLMGATFNRLAISIWGRWLGLLGFSVSFMGLVMPAYYAPLTDSIGLLLATLAVYALVRRSTLLFVLAASLAVFSWPTAGHLAILLAGFGAPRPNASSRSPSARRWSDSLGLLAFVFVVMGGIGAKHLGFTPTLVYRDATPRWDLLLPLSIGLAALYVGIGTQLLVEETLKEGRPSPRWPGILVAGVVILGSLLTSTWVRSVGKSVLEMVFLNGDSIFGRSTVAPGVFWIAHLTYFGPYYGLGCLLFRPLARRLAGLGLGASLTLAGALLLSLTSESRHLISFWPLFVLGLTLELDRWVGPREVAIFGVLAILWSKAWLVPHTFWANGRPDLTRYFMHQGPWMVRPAYLVQGVAGVLTVLMFWWWWRSKQRAQPRAVVG